MCWPHQIFVNHNMITAEQNNNIRVRTVGIGLINEQFLKIYSAQLILQLVLSTDFYR
ncbi:hypothetical protein O3M35_013105 [Rhynocoris fuscipes]|uniref:Uncharacterized protein n=1 Tax=Rhynocoris fuscipes TaxID=488301 RepID=A0AAW1CIP4_9HEMI